MGNHINPFQSCLFLGRLHRILHFTVAAAHTLLGKWGKSSKGENADTRTQHVARDGWTLPPPQPQPAEPAHSGWELCGEGKRKHQPPLSLINAFHAVLHIEPERRGVTLGAGGRRGG